MTDESLGIHHLRAWLAADLSWMKPLESWDKNDDSVTTMVTQQRHCKKLTLNSHKTKDCNSATQLVLKFGRVATPCSTEKHSLP